MADTSVSYKCPNCSAPLSFLPGHDKVTCEYCGTEFEVKTIEEMFAKQEERAAQAEEAREAKWGYRPCGQRIYRRRNRLPEIVYLFYLRCGTGLR